MSFYGTTPVSKHASENPKSLDRNVSNTDKKLLYPVFTPSYLYNAAFIIRLHFAVEKGINVILCIGKE